MSAHWTPGGGWSRRRARRGGFSTSDLRLMLFGGIAVGLFATQVEWPSSLEGGETGYSASGGVAIGAAAIRVIDGDTIHHRGTRIRIADIDTPEMAGQCADESALAARAKRRLRTLLDDGAVALHPNPDGRDEDRYGRKLRIVTVSGRSVGDTLVAEGLARTWTGRREPWC